MTLAVCSVCESADAIGEVGDHRGNVAVICSQECADEAHRRWAEPKIVRFIEVTFEEGEDEGPFVGEVTLWDDGTMTIETYDCMPDIDGGGWKVASLARVAEAILELQRGGGTKQEDVQRAVREG